MSYIFFFLNREKHQHFICGNCSGTTDTTGIRIQNTAEYLLIPIYVSDIPL